ncbi:hypothetical protein P167DRAFT_491776 [Morchella conica CCBAS932]|uniref:rhamnogalacturonan endolyase n=1 Tax=Morchella conica CCBAS932 TaxID=1392247 RepID=A0A3N4KHE8_9PEZI|nr:hypothetical protein P167DRAFT_491776 [Morchella conica CCBAS932]
MLLKSLFGAAALFCTSALAAFGVTDSGTQLTVDTNGGLVFKVNKSTGDIISLVYNGVECQDSSKFSHISSGLGSSNVVATTSGSYIKITVTTDTLIQYYIAKLRFIARLKKSALPNGVTASDVEGGTVVEGSDVFLVDGQTRSKFYSSKRFIEDQVHCVTGSSVAACMVIPGYSYESASGGPFFRDIDNQGSAQQELYFYMNSGHVQTEAYRMGLHGPYGLVFTSGSTASSTLDFSFFSSLSITGFVPVSSRGYVSGTVSGVTSDGVVHWKNSAAQYWVSSTGSFTSPAMKPGTYDMILYSGEYQVASTTVTVTAGSTTSKSITATAGTASVVFRIGAVDGRPTGFKNAANQLVMHPSDSRMSSWSPVTFAWGTSSTADFPMAQIKTVNDPTTITVTLTAAQAAAARTLKIYTTLSFAGGRPSVVFNSYTAATPAAPTKIDSRGFTRGAYRGYGEVYSFPISTSNLIAGVNTIQISCASGSSGDTYLNPNFIYDSIELF